MPIVFDQAISYNKKWSITSHQSFTTVAKTTCQHYSGYCYIGWTMIELVKNH